MKPLPVHAMRPDENQTWCGVAAWPSACPSSEADIISGDRIDIVGGSNHRATCRKCIGARNMAAKSAGGMSGKKT